MAVQRVDDIPALPPRPIDAHKGSCGTVVVVAGSDGMLGAAILTAQGALRGGAGLVRCVLPEALMPWLTVGVPCATTRRRDGAPAEWVAGASAVVVGPGLGQGAGVRAMVDGVRAAAPAVLDADALNALAPLADTAAAPVAEVWTPHPGEAARLLDCAVGRIAGDREAAALELARRSGAVVVLKGAGTVVTDGARLFVNPTGNAGMATGGSGDVLAGLTGALLALGMPPFDAARAAVHAHGAAGDLVAARLSQTGVTAADLPLAIAEVLRP